MKPILSAEQMRQLDHFTIEMLGVPSRRLMRRAASAVLDVIHERYPRAGRLLIFAGPGNNGGDGIALACLARKAGLKPTVVLCHPEPEDPPQLSADAAYYYKRWQRLGGRTIHFSIANPNLSAQLELERFDLIVDALFGTGLSRPLDPFYYLVCGLINREQDRYSRDGRLPVLSIDLPSGMNATTGLSGRGHVQADLTVTFQYQKLGLLHPQAVDYSGEVVVAPIGLADPAEAEVPFQATDCDELLWEPLLEPRRPTTHKGDYGRLLIIGGCRRYPGAPRLAAQAALRMGSGLTRLLVPQGIYNVACTEPAVMVDWHPECASGGFAAEPATNLLEYLDWADAIVLGPGLGSDEETVQLCRTILSRVDKPTVLDADGLRALGAQPLQPQRRWPLLLTPHIGEIGRLAGMDSEGVLSRWFELGSELAAAERAFILSKSYQCMLTTPEGLHYFPGRGHAALAKGGSGDVLSGMLGALLARARHAEAGDDGNDVDSYAMALPELVCSAVNLISEAAQMGAELYGENGVTPSDLPEMAAQVLNMAAYGSQL